MRIRSSACSFIHSFHSTIISYLSVTLCKKQQEYKTGKDTIPDLESSYEKGKQKMSLIIAIKWNKGKDKDMYKMECDTKRRVELS